ncbi:carbohydrate sulfotransferase 15-like isoform X2 [Pomacea canaliculata]|uniref:carbohydrate sulfotransferase 15-like isoform X2 n=1 Tax=Pomacea canaliculata TaxID=400727 RepID=UPI000D736EE4|nr:carbohydrate sulfotransferase 15-like isoform X2 [Pomacea canaliculata]XP_025108549.1 carbohydrate sulfotransferase 15-like isoform X2 [Pomacea canaliculata]
MPREKTGKFKDTYVREEPRQYLNSTKNPCWFDNSTYPNLLCLPYFYVAGVAKSGTSDLFRRIALHPDVMEGMKKEYHWWDYGRYMEGGNIPLADYARMVTGEQGSKTVESEILTKGTSDKIFGDRSTSIFRDVHRWRFLDGNRGCQEPRVLIGHHIRHVTPMARIILSFRHPTYRLYSRFLARIPELKRGSSVTFHKLVVKAVRLYRDCFARLSLRHCAYNETLFESTGVRLVGGMYSIFLEDWLRIFPRSHIYVMRYEDYATDMLTEINKIYAFLHLAKLNGTVMKGVLDDVKLKAGILYEKVGPMMPETMDILNDFYEPFMENLADILQDERFLWRDMEIP